MTFQIIPNPAYAGREPTIMVAQCHDCTPFRTVQPGCGHALHMHESQIDAAAAQGAIEMAARCPTCGSVEVLEVQHVLDAFAQMRADGWIA